MENKRLLTVAILLIFSIVMIFVCSKTILERQNNKEKTNQQLLLAHVSLQYWNNSILAIEADAREKEDPLIVRDLL